MTRDNEHLKKYLLTIWGFAIFDNCLFITCAYLLSPLDVLLYLIYPVINASSQALNFAACIFQHSDTFGFQICFHLLSFSGQLLETLSFLQVPFLKTTELNFVSVHTQLPAWSILASYFEYGVTIT